MSNPNDLLGGGDDFSIWHLGPRPDVVGGNGRRRVDFGGYGDGNLYNETDAGPYSVNSTPRPSPRLPTVDDRETSYSRIKHTAFNMVSLVTENVFLHPFLVVRRQCQVNRRSLRYHLTPFTVVQFMARTESTQGLGSFWKGAGSVLITRGLLLSTESFLAEFLAQDREISGSSVSLDKVWRRILLKTLAFGIITPFFCSSCIETVQSSIASETPGIFDCLKEGVLRCFHWSRSSSARLLPLWIVCGATVSYHICHYLVHSTVQSTLLWWKRRKYVKNGVTTPEIDYIEYNEALSHLWASLVADVLLFPMETVLHRLYLQGTRTLIDSVDQNNRVIPVISDYEGTVDCYKTIVREEGTAGLFKGFGALVLQYIVHFAILKSTKLILQQVVPNIKKV